MADLNDLIKKLNEAADKIDQELPSLLLESEITAKSLVQKRIQDEGKDKDGKKIGDYSQNKIPAFFYLGKGTKKSDVKVRKAIKEKKKLSYADFRRLDGKQNKFVDLTFTGQMFRDIGVTETNNNSKEASIVIAPKTKRSEEVAGYNTERFGNFLAPSEEELELLAEDLGDSINNILNSSLNGL